MSVDSVRKSGPGGTSQRDNSPEIGALRVLGPWSRWVWSESGPYKAVVVRARWQWG